jgi:transposase
VLIAGGVTVFRVAAGRGQEAGRTLLGSFAGVLVTDRWGGYNFFSGRRQICWAHLKRDFQSFAEMSGLSGMLGGQLQAERAAIFKWWQRVRDGTCSRSKFQREIRPHQKCLEELLEAGAGCAQLPIAGKCAEILKFRRALWTFVKFEGVEPTNNAAEQAIRPAVLWRKGSFGCQSERGCRFVERVLTAHASCKQQGRSIVAYLTEVCHAHFQGHPIPSLLPNENRLSHVA